MQPLHSPRRRALSIAGAFAATLPALPAAWAQQPKRGGTLVIGSTQAPRHLNGGVQSGFATALPSTQLFASPLRFDDKWNARPYLAEKWVLAPDGKSLTLNLRRNAVFHDGRPVTSADVAFSIMAIKASHPFQTMFGPVERVETPDAATAIVRMSTPHPAIVLAMSPALCPILPKHIYDDGTDLKVHPRNSTGLVGSGPFKLTEFAPGQRIVLDRFDRFFFPDRPFLDKVIVTINPDPSSIALGLERGDIHMIPFANNPAELKRFKANPNLSITPKGYEGVGPIDWLAFNTEKKPFNDKRVRQALAYAIDKNFITKVLYGGFAARGVGPIVPASPFADPALPTFDFDPKKSMALLDEAGLKPGANGERLKLVIDFAGGNDAQKSVAEYIRAQFKKVGVAADVRVAADFPTWAKRIASHDFDLTTDNVWNWGDPIIGVHRTYLSSNIRPIIWTNTQSYNNPKVDELLANAGGLIDPTQRKAYYATFQKMVVEDMPIHFLNVSPFHTAMQKKVGNAPTTIWGVLSPLDEVFLG